MSPNFEGCDRLKAQQVVFDRRQRKRLDSETRLLSFLTTMDTMKGHETVLASHRGAVRQLGQVPAVSRLMMDGLAPAARRIAIQPRIP